MPVPVPAYPTLPPAPNADLHCHSVFSDGCLSPEALAARAHAQGVTLWSLTDHDDLGGQPRAKNAAQALGMAYISGVEISVTFADETVHLLGYGIDEHHPALLQGLAGVRGGRLARAQEMGASLARAGIPGAYEGARALAPNLDLLSRTHFARYMVRQGHCSSVGEVFQRYLKPGLPGYVAHRWADLGEALQWIHQAGGAAAVAHPARYPFAPATEEAFFSQFKAHGGAAVEVVSGSHTAADIERIAALACRFGLLATRGSDFHSPGESRADLGALPPLPAGLTPLWSIWPQAATMR